MPIALGDPWSLAQQTAPALRALTMTAVVIGLGASLLVVAMLLFGARRRWMQRLGRQHGAAPTMLVDAWAESARRMGAGGPGYVRETLDGGAEHDTVDLDPEDSPEDPDGDGTRGPR